MPIFLRDHHFRICGAISSYSGIGHATRGTPRRKLVQQLVPTPNNWFRIHVTQDAFLFENVEVRIHNIRKSESTAPGLECSCHIIPVGEMKFNKFSPLSVLKCKECCGTNGLIQLHLVTKPFFKEVVKEVKDHVKEYLDHMRTGVNPVSVLRLPSCGCIPVSHITDLACAYGNHT